MVSDRVPNAFNRSGAIWSVVLDIFKAFERVWYHDLFQKLLPYVISDQIFGNRWFRVVVDENSSQKYLVIKASVSQGSILGLTVFLLYINDVLDEFFL